MRDAPSIPTSVCPYATSGLTLDNWEAVLVELVTEPPATTAVVVWRGRKSLVWPLPLKPIRQLRAGDVVVFQGERRVVAGVSAWR